MKKKRLKKVARFLGSKAFLGSLLFAASLWTYTNLNSEYVTLVRIPLTIVLPENRAVENPLPDEITVQVRGLGWNLFNLLFFNSAARCYIDLSNEKIQSSSFEISHNDILKSLQFFANVQPIDVFPQNLDVITGKVGEYVVPVKSLVKIVPREGFDIVGDVVIKPDLIVIRGNDKVVSRILKWYTQPIVLENVYGPVNVQVPLYDTLSNIVRLSQQSITLIADVEQIAETTIPDVKFNIRGGSLPHGHKIMPEQVSVTVRGGIAYIENLTQESITAYIDYTQIANDSTGIIVPKISLPENVKLIQLDPPFLKHVKTVQ